MRKVMLIGAEKTFIREVARTLRDSRIETMEIDDFTRAQREISRFEPELIVVSLNDSEGAGWRLLFQEAQSTSHAVIAMTDDTEDAQEIVALRLGIVDYVRLPASAKLLAERINLRLGRDTVPRPTKAAQIVEAHSHRGTLMINTERFEVTWLDRPVTMTKTEFFVLELLARTPGTVKTRDQLMDHIYSDDIYVTDRTVDSHIKRIRSKLRAVDPDFDEIEAVYGVGYRINLSSAAPRVPAAGYTGAGLANARRIALSVGSREMCARGA